MQTMKLKLLVKDMEKNFKETLCSKEEMAKADDIGGFYRIPADFRDLNYSKYVQENTPLPLLDEEYNSHITYRLNVDELKNYCLH